MSRPQFKLWRAAINNPALVPVITEIRTALGGCRTILDVGCGNLTPLRFLQNVRLVGLDGYAPSIEESRRLGVHDELYLDDVRNIAERFKDRHFDACVAIDVIEHLPKDDGWRMLEQMEQLAEGRVLIFTPNGFVPQHSKDGDLQEHVSGWSAEDFRQRGYRVTGKCGPKSFRGEYHRLKCKPRIFWGAVSLLSDYFYVRSRPEAAAALLCVRDRRGK